MVSSKGLGGVSVHAWLDASCVIEAKTSRPVTMSNLFEIGHFHVMTITGTTVPEPCV